MLFLGLGFAGMLACGWLFDRASSRLSDKPEQTEPAPEPATATAILRYLATAALFGLASLALYRTSLLVADLILIAAGISFLVAAHKARFRPLLAVGISAPHAALLWVSLVLWLLPFGWFVHLHLRGLYAAP